MVILAVAVALAIAAGITLLGLSGARDGYEDETGFHSGTPNAQPRLIGTGRSEFSNPTLLRMALSKDAVDPVTSTGASGAGNQPLVGPAVLSTN